MVRRFICMCKRYVGDLPVSCVVDGGRGFLVGTVLCMGVPIRLPAEG